jgi:hypothetical protein
VYGSGHRTLMLGNCKMSDILHLNVSVAQDIKTRK